MSTHRALMAGLVFGGALAWLAAGQDVMPGTLPSAAPAPPAGSRNVQVLPTVLGKDRTGVVVVDADFGSICVYELSSSDSATAGAMKLIAARSFIYDRHLSDFNQIGLKPADVRQLTAGVPVQADAIPAGGPAAPAAVSPQQTNTPVQMASVQLTPDRFGLAMLDAARNSVWVYEFVTNQGRLPHGMRLFSARTFAFDRDLPAYRQLPPLPAQVWDLVKDAQLAK